MPVPVRILQVLHSMNRGGTESMIMSLYRNIDREKVQFDFVENTDKEAAYDQEILSLGGKIYHCPHYNGKNHFAYVKWWNDFFKQHRGEYHVIHGHLGSTAAIYLPIAKKNGLFTIAHSHNTTMSKMYSAFSYPTRYIADHFFGCSRLAGEFRYGRKIVKSSRYMTLNNAINSEQYRYNQSIRDEVREEFELGDLLVVGTVGRLNYQKNPNGMIEIIKELHVKNPNIRFLWIGGGELYASIKQRIQEEELEDCVIMTGVRNDVYRLLQAIDVFILPSLYEGLPVVAIEAQAAGLPCFISDRVTEECNITGRCRFLPIEQPELWANAILSTDLLHTDTHQQIIDAGYDIHTTAKWLENFYLNLASNRR